MAASRTVSASRPGVSKKLAKKVQAIDMGAVRREAGRPGRARSHEVGIAINTPISMKAGLPIRS
jgi:hypothetical protein